MKEMYKEKNYVQDGWKMPKIYDPVHASKARENIEKACEIVGSAAKLSRLLCFGHQAIINKWKNRGGCPPKDAWRIEILTLGKVKAQDVCREPIYRNKY